MKNLFGLTKHHNSSIAKNSNKGLMSDRSLARLPLPILFICSLLLTLPVTREFAIAMLAENRPIELLSFAFLIAAGVKGLVLVWQLRQQESKKIILFYLLLALGFLAIGAEEIAWGQWFFGFETPAGLSEINTQNELTLHNLELFNDHLEIFPLLFGVAGIASVWTNKIAKLRKISSPSVLLSWYSIITFVSGIDLIQDFFIIQEQFDYLINHLDEVVEMLVAIACFLYISLNSIKLNNLNR